MDDDAEKKKLEAQISALKARHPEYFLGGADDAKKDHMKRAAADWDGVEDPPEETKEERYGLKKKIRQIQGRGLR